MYEDPKSKISQLEKVLDAREDRVFKRVIRHELHDKNVSVNQNWDDSEFIQKENTFESTQGQNNISLATKILFGSIIFFIIALVVVLYKFMGGINMVSGDNIEVTVKAPISVSGGEVIPFEIEVKNNNNTTISSVDFGVNFPLGATSEVDTSQPAKRIQEFLGDILPGQSVKKNMKVILFGQENEKKNITITLEYKVAGSNSLFNKSKIVSILISSAPVSIVVAGPKEVNTNQSVDFVIDVTSNSTAIMKNLLLRVDYPFGFSFTDSSPKTFSKNNTWLIGDLEPGAKRTIKISGILNGQEGEERGFSFNLGSQSKVDSSLIDVPFSSSFSSVTIRRPFVSADISFNKVDTTEYVSLAGSDIETLIKWQNNLPYEVSNVSIIIKINGNSLDKGSVQVDNGFYQSIDNTIIFNKTTDNTLAILSPGQKGESKFDFRSFGAGTVTGSGLINPTITLDITVQGQRVGYTSDQADILSSESRKIKISSDPQIFAKALYYVGPFQNNGPVPPKSEQETTYTVTWTVTNPLNNLSGAVISATLPPYIKWLSVISPEREKINYDASTGLVTWNIGNITAGAGSVVPAREVSFQVSLIPSVSQIGTAPVLVGEVFITAKDNFTLTAVSDSFPELTTRLSNDPYFKVDSETVIK